MILICCHIERNDGFNRLSVTCKNFSAKKLGLPDIKIPPFCLNCDTRDRAVSMFKRLSEPSRKHPYTIIANYVICFSKKT